MRKRKSLGAETDSFSVRWHSVADMNTPSADIMSSPDPLNETIEQSVMPSSTRRVVRSSQRSSRFSSMGMGTSPRKQTFELEVGDNKAPQRLLVTVETEEPAVTAGPSSARRKLFQDSPYLPAARRRDMATTTTTVPLKGAIEDQTNDPNATPRRRGRPRKTNGTPLPSAGTKRKGTPISGTPRQRQRTSKDTDTADKTTENNAQPTPGTKKRGRPRKNPLVEPPSDFGNEPDQAITSTTNDLQKQQAFAPEAVDDTTDLPSLRADDSQADNDVTLVFTPSEAEANQLRANRTANNTAPAQQSEPDSDIWMATLDDEPTPRPASRATQAAPAPSSPDHGQADGSSDFGDYGYGPAGSDVSSADDPQSDIRPGNEDTAAGEDFSMIFMDSLPSLQASLRSSVREITENDIGEETSMIINNTLESLRQSLQDRDRPNTDEGTAKQGEKSQQSKEHGPAEPQEQLRQSTIRPPMSFSPGRSLSARWLQSPRRMGSPLRHEVLKSSVRENTDAPEYRGSPLASQRQDSSHLGNEESNLYDDSFSEIPDVVLEAATPRRPRAAAKGLVSESNDVEMEDAQLIQLEEGPEEPEQQEDEQVPEGQEDQEEREKQAEQEEEEVGPPAASNVSAVSRSDAGRLPTPDDTPPNIEVGSDNVQKSTGVSQSSARSASSRGSSLKNSSPAPETQAQIEPEFIEEAPEIVDDEPVNEDNELMIDDAGVSLQEPDDHSDLEDHILEETLIEHPEEEEGQEEEHEEEEALPEAPAPQKARLSLETENQQAEVTPLNQLTSPIQEQVTLPEMVSERASRPTLSPIVRAGRALQSVTSDPPSPEARDHHLRSPFRRSATRELGPRETQSNRRTSASPGKSRAFPDAGQIPQDNEIYDDPFRTHTRHTGQSSFMEALERSSRGSSPRHRRTASRESIASSIRFQAPSEGGMSWVDNEGPISDNLRGDVPLEAFARSTARHPKSPSISHGQMDGTVDDADDETEDAGDDMDLWEFEAERSIVQPTRQPPTERKPESPVHRRSNIPSSWRRQPTRETQPAASVEHQTRSEIQEVEESVDEETAPQAEPMETTHEEPSQAEEYSLVTNKEAAQEANKAPASAKPTRFDLSTFFSSPAAFPGMLADKLSPLKKMSGFGTRPAEPEPVEMEQTLPTSSMFPQVPQHELAPRAQPRAGFFSPIRSVQPALRREVSEEPERELRSRSNSRSHKTSSSGRSEVPARQEEHGISVQEMSEQQQESEQQEDTEQEEPDELEEAEEVEEPEELEDLEEAQAAESLPSVPQKVNFTPQRRQPRQSFFKTSTQAAAPAAASAPDPIPATGAPTPPRMQLTHADIHKWQQQTSNESDDSPERPPARPILRPLPPKNASPYKSSLRSPLKPHTPGRVVEFTSSVLSPVEQAKVRHQRRLSNSSAASQSSAGAQRPRLGPPPRQTANKENNTLFEVPMSKIGLPIKQPRPEPLSQTVWTRKHWLLLDDLLQKRRQGPFRLNFERYSDKFLGKTVTSHGEAMTLERWHLDCVDAFKAQVGGWDEAALAKRLFALIIGEQRRNQEGAAKPARVMFH
ncbi:uncharacterized protein FTOL_12884 [Fusarium torulosum]|uniref:Uncharacterized protein n=1 Tax=Fusarium torulosum TaxID=33205 RepID=A0AAE8SPE6_9HYPO|nr:uncharacterized protein FTOL_12884 [Fusarium torulosum]